MVRAVRRSGVAVPATEAFQNARRVGRSTTQLSAVRPRNRRQIHHTCVVNRYLHRVPTIDDLYPRRAYHRVSAALSDTRVVVINGARQAGKSTLARLVMQDYPGAELRYLDEAAVRSAAEADPAAFVRQAEEPVRLYHYRDRDGFEVDAILERASGEVVAVEVKAAETVRREDFRGIQRLARRLGDRMLAGIVLYAGGKPFRSATVCALSPSPQRGPPGVVGLFAENAAGILGERAAKARLSG
jgi:Holliday junction resolvase-like predicted endonuclease